MTSTSASTIKFMAMLIACLAISACVSLPDVYLIDRHTVMEAEASGEWPELDKRFRQQAVKAGPTPLAKETESKRRARSFQVLNSEFTSESTQ